MAAKAKATKAKSTIYIPEELVTEILVQLPVKTLLICKSVCKTWLSIISNPRFTKSQLQRAITNPTLLDIEESGKAKLKKELLDNPDSSLIRINSTHVMPRLLNHTRFVNSYDGIICLDSIRWNLPGVYLWNPSIRQYKELPFVELSSYSYRKLGFGYDSISDDYKVVRILYQMPADNFLTVQVYSNNANSWREFKNPILKKLGSFDRHCIVVEGVLYLGNEDELISFDLHQEVLGLVTLPSFGKKQRRSDVMDFQDSVAVFFESVPGITDLWTLDGVSSHNPSWTIKFSINIHADLKIRLHSYLGAGQFYGSESDKYHFCKNRSCIRRYTFNNKFRCPHASSIKKLNEKHSFVFDYQSKEMRNNGVVAENVHATLKYSETLVSLDGFVRLVNRKKKVAAAATKPIRRSARVPVPNSRYLGGSWYI